MDSGEKDGPWTLIETCKGHIWKDLKAEDLNFLWITSEVFNFLWRIVQRKNLHFLGKDPFHKLFSTDVGISECVLSRGLRRARAEAVEKDPSEEPFQRKTSGPVEDDGKGREATNLSQAQASLSSRGHLGKKSQLWEDSHQASLTEIWGASVKAKNLGANWNKGPWFV